MALTAALMLALASGACDESNPFEPERLDETSTLEAVDVDISPDGAIVDSGQVLQFTAKLTDSNGDRVNGAVDWETDAGTITTGGLLTADSKPGRRRVVAKHRGNGPNKRDLADTTIVVVAGATDESGPASIQVSPQTVVVSPGDSVRFSFALLDSNGGAAEGSAQWSADGGVIDGDGLFIAGEQA